MLDTILSAAADECGECRTLSSRRPAAECSALYSLTSSGCRMPDALSRRPAENAGRSPINGLLSMLDTPLHGMLRMTHALFCTVGGECPNLSSALPAANV